VWCLLVISCGDDPETTARKNKELQLKNQQQATADSLRKRDSLKQVIKAKAESRYDSIGYSTVCIHTSNMLDSIKSAFKSGVSKDSSKILAMLNRKELRYIRVGDTVLLPSVINKDTKAYSVLPQYYPAAADIPKIILISNKYQCYGCYEHGELVRFAACNTGTKGKPTFPGRYAVNWKQEMRISSLNMYWKLPFTVNFHLYAGNAFHQFDMPGRPVSHSCVRQYMDDAKWLFKWVKVAKLDSHKKFIPYTGTPVIILDMFNYNRKRGGPWWELKSNKDVVISLPEKPMEVEEALIPMSQVPKDARGAVPNRKRYLFAYDTLVKRGVIDTTFKLRESIDYNKLREGRVAARKKAEDKKKEQQQPEVKKEG